MIQRVLLAAIAAGIAAGLFVSLAQEVKVVPLILEAESFETLTTGGAQAAAHSHAAEEAGAHSHGEGEAWGPEDGFERIFFTVGSNIVAGVGFGLLLAAAMVMRGGETNLRNGVLWGLAGFFVFSLAPAVGLPPELPGMQAAGVGERQMWWVLTVGCSAVGLALLVWKAGWIYRLAGIALIALPHLVGAPHPELAPGNVPAELAAQFAVVSLVTTALFWVVLGSLCGYFFQRLSR